MAPTQRNGEGQRIKYPGVLDVVKRSPGAIGPFTVVALAWTIPTIATGTVGLPCPPRTMRGCVETIPATRVS